MTTAKGEASRAFLLRASAGVFARHGYGAATMAQLIAASGLTKGAFYFHFPSKAQLALAVLEDQQARWFAAVDSLLTPLPTAGERIRALLPTLLDVIEGDPATWAVNSLARELVSDPELAGAVRVKMRRWVDTVAELLRAGQAEGSIRSDLDAEPTAAVMVAAFDGLKVQTDVLDAEDERGAALRGRAEVLLALMTPALFV